MRRKILVTLILVAVLLTAGCVGGGKKEEVTAKGPGVIITDFRTDFSEIEASEKMTLALDFENRGDFDAKGLNATLVRAGAFNVSDTSYIDLNILEQPIGDSFPSEEFYWDITAPNVTQDRVDEVQARLAYNYTSEGFATIHFVPKDLLREKGAEAFQISTSSTNSPIGIDITANQPVVIREGDITDDSYAEKEVRLSVFFNNDWEGRAESLNTPVNTWDCTKKLDCIDVVMITAAGGSCDVHNGSGSGAGYETLSFTKNGVKMLQGEQGRFTKVFKFNVTDPYSETSCQLRVKAGYRYRVDSSVLSVQIKAKD